MTPVESLFNSQYILLCVILFFITVFFLLEDNLRKLPHYTLKSVTVFIFAALFIFLFGMRDFTIGTDTPIYLYLFGSEYAEHKDVGFQILTSFLKGLTNERGYLFILAFIYVAGLVVFLRIWNRKMLFYIFFMFVGLFIFKNMGMNVLRQGIACIFCLLGIAMDRDRKFLLAITFYIISISMQVTCVIPIAAWYLSRFINMPVAFAIVVISSLLSIAGLGFDKLAGFLPFLSGMFENRFDSYIEGTENKDYIIGFRASFFAFNWFFILVGLYIYRKFKTDELHQRILRMFAVLSGIFFLYFNLQYSDRIGLLSWIFIPMLFIPIFEKKKIGAFYKVFTILIFIIVFIYFIIFPSK